jgi:hypothetical protein
LIVKNLLNEIIPIILRVPLKEMAFQLYADNKLLLNSGKVGMSEDTSRPERGLDYVTFTPHNKEITFVLVVSNFHNYRGGFLQPMSMGSTGAMLQYRINGIALELFVTGILFIMECFVF